MKKILFLTLLCIFASFPLTAQDAHLQQMVEGVKTLRKSGDALRQKLENEWSGQKMPKVVLMDNARRDGNEYSGKGAFPFKLNQVINHVYKRQNILLSSKGDFFNSAEKGIHYSAIEKTIKAGKTATYHITGHIGHQQFMFVAFNKKSNFTVKVNGKAAIDQSDGVQFVDLGEVSEDDTITIAITNNNKARESFAILCHNPQKP